MEADSAPPLAIEGENRVRVWRERLGLTQKELAASVGVSRQSLNAVETNRATPSVAIALRLARALGTDVESLFAGAAGEAIEALLVGAAPRAGARVIVGSVRERWVAHPLASDQFAPSQYAADGFVRHASRAGRGQVEIIRSARDLRQTLLVGGCAPGLSVLCDRLNGAPGPGTFRWLTQANGAALRALSRGHVHLAGVHMGHDSAGALARSLARHLPSERACVYALATWEAGLVVACGNPKQIRGVAQLAQPRLRLSLREPGSGARAQLERLLKLEGIELSALQARAIPASSHMDVARGVQLGAADVGFTIRAAALAFGLEFVPLLEERFDLVVPDYLSDDARAQRLLEALSSAAFRRELEELGYDAAVAGRKITEVSAG